MIRARLLLKHFHRYTTRPIEHFSETFSRDLCFQEGGTQTYNIPSRTRRCSRKDNNNESFPEELRTFQVNGRANNVTNVPALAPLHVINAFLVEREMNFSALAWTVSRKKNNPCCHRSTAGFCENSFSDDGARFL